MNDELIPVETPMKDLAVRPQGGVDFAREAVIANVVAHTQAGYGLARINPRDMEQAISDMLEACSDFSFAQSANYRIPFWDRRKGRKIFVRGKSKWYTDEAAIHFRHIHRSCELIFDDANKRIIAVTVRDLQANNAVTLTAEINKRDLKGSKNLDLQTAAERSKLERNCILKLLPVAFQKRADAKISEVVKEKAFTNRDRLVAGMAKYDVTPEMIGKYFGVDPKELDPEQCVELLEIGTAIKDNIATWGDFASGEADHVGTGLSLNDFRPKEDAPQEAPATETVPIFPNDAGENFIADIWYEFSGGMSDKALAAAEKIVFKFYKVKSIAEIQAGPDDFRSWLDMEVTPALEKQGLI